MKKGDIYEGVITEYDFPNKGSLMLEDRKVTIKGALKGQKVRFMITKRKSGLAEGRVLEVLERAACEDEVPSCKYFGICGGCAYSTMSYGEQLKLKEDMVKKLLDRVITEEYEWEGIVPSPVVAGYRNKMEFTFGDEFKGGPLAVGLHRKGNFYDILNVSGCEIIGSDWSKILDYTQEFFRDRQVPFYHRMAHEGILRNLVVRHSVATDEFLINLITSTQWDRYGYGDGANVLKDYADGLVALSETGDFSGKIAGILYTENDALGDVVKCDRMVCLYGRDYIMEEVMGLKFRISPFSFFQTNTKGCEVLYTKAREYIMSGMEDSGKSGDVSCEKCAVGKDSMSDSDVRQGEDVVGRDSMSDCDVRQGENVVGEDSMSDCDVRQGEDVVGKDKVVFDLYSGTGTIAQMMASASKKVIGIEIVEEAVEAAKENAALNGLDNCEFIAGDVLKAIDLVEVKPDLIILDPPRDGINPKALDKIMAFGVDEIVYISCKPTSLARDLAILTSHGYRVVKACAVDQFPRTEHVESIVLLSQKVNR